MLEETINEGSTSQVTLAFTDITGAPLSITSGQYRIDDVDSGTTILGWTDLPSLGESVTVQITSDQNRIVRPHVELERRMVTAKGVAGASVVRVQASWLVFNLTYFATG